MKTFRVILAMLFVAGVNACGMQRSIPPQIRLEPVAERFTSPVALIDATWELSALPAFKTFLQETRMMQRFG
jgi:hypothetical protein